MEERLPPQVFNRPPLSEVPQRLNQPISRQETIGVYNSVFARFMEQRLVLEERARNDEFSALGNITEKINRGETLTQNEQLLIEDYAMLLEINTANFGRRNLNAASLVIQLERQTALGIPLTAEDQGIRENYQAGNFHLINGIDHHLQPDIIATRFTVPARDADQDFAIRAGVPVEGMIRFIDREIRDLQGTWMLGEERNRRLNRLRYERDLLFTQSTPLFSREDSTFHAMTQTEGLFNSKDPLRGEWHLPDWFNAELVLRERRVLNIPQDRGHRRWVGCLPLLLPLLIPVCLGLNFYTHPCAGTGGQLRVEVFDTEGAADASIKGHLEREMVYLEEGINPGEFRKKDDAALVSVIDTMRDERLQYYKEYLRFGEGDHLEAGQRFNGRRDGNPWIKGTDFSGREVLASCLTPEQRKERALQEVDRQNNPQWYHPFQRALEQLQHWATINLR